MYLTMPTLQLLVGEEVVLQHMIKQLLLRIFYAPHTVREWRHSSP